MRRRSRPFQVGPSRRFTRATTSPTSTTNETSKIPAGIHLLAAFTRPGYRGKLWTMRQFAGFGTPQDTNARYKDLLRAGGTGLSVAFDLPTLMGRDPDHELALGEVGKCG